MPPITNRVAPESLVDLFVAPQRATLAWEEEGRLELEPVRYGQAEGRHFVARAAGLPPPPAGARASLVLDDGWTWFALRAATLRGRLAAAVDPPPGRIEWRELVAEKVTAWDYARLRDEPAT